jgi:hypothetical protein
MDNLPRELIDGILQQCIALGTRNEVLRLRLVCRGFDRFLKPFACRTLDVEFSRLSKASSYPRPTLDALQTIGYHCKSVYIDLMVLRDESKFFFFFLKIYIWKEAQERWPLYKLAWKNRMSDRMRPSEM